MDGRGDEAATIWNPQVRQGRGLGVVSCLHAPRSTHAISRPCRQPIPCSSTTSCAAAGLGCWWGREDCMRYPCVPAHRSYPGQGNLGCDGAGANNLCGLVPTRARTNVWLRIGACSVDERGEGPHTAHTCVSRGFATPPLPRPLPACPLACLPAEYDSIAGTYTTYYRWGPDPLQPWTLQSVVRRPRSPSSSQQDWGVPDAPSLLSPLIARRPRRCSSPGARSSPRASAS